MKKVLKGYIFSRPFLGERVPQSIQNLVLRDYCTRNNFIYELSTVEYCMKDSLIHLNNLIKNLNLYSGILCYSLFQLPSDPNMRYKILKKIVSKKKAFHFAVENQFVSSKKDIGKINDFWAIKKTLVENTL